MTETIAVQIRGLRHVYRNDGDQDVEALAGIDLSVRSGEFLAIVGPSGCGKSTLLGCIAGVIDPSEGQITIEGALPREAIRRRRIGLVFQDPCLLSWRTVRENVGLPLELNRGQRELGAEREIDDLIQSMLLKGFERNYPSELSGGMRSRAAIARALVLSPSVLLMDEPFGALDELTTEMLNQELLSILEKRQPTVILVTHNISQAVFVADRVLILTGRPGRVFQSVEVSLGRPRREAITTSPEFMKLVAAIQEALRQGSGFARREE